SSRRRHTRWPRDWSSDVCSSDLVSEFWRTQFVPLGLVMIVPLSPVATIVFGEAATLLSRALVGAGRLVQFVPSGLIRTVPLSPVTRNKLRKTPTPCRSLVVGRGWMSCQTTPKVLMDWLVPTT